MAGREPVWCRAGDGQVHSAPWRPSRLDRARVRGGGVGGGVVAAVGRVVLSPCLSAAGTARLGGEAEASHKSASSSSLF
ncbi:hypothetical protein E2C01_024801 [Portunus trituberculatus]|uniref:Uncharacterized protein n=1 Tax=Portunus trituberculatus TaxID=210409 RepID=A0A5B7EDU5_PORTR|nr:hypothetical protein [Portunus trituberculatus]